MLKQTTITPPRPFRRVLLALALVLSWSQSAAAGDTKSEYQAAKADFEALLKHPTRSRQREPYVKLIRRFDAIEKADRRGNYGHRACFMAARLAEELSLASRVPGDLDGAMERMQRVARDHSSSNLADDALLAAARMALERRGDQREARAVLEDLLARFPRGDMVPQARELLTRLPSPEPKPEPSVAAAAAKPAPPSAADSSAEDAPETDPVDRIGELLKKAELIRTEAGGQAPEAAVLEAEVALLKAEGGDKRVGAAVPATPATATATPAEPAPPRYQPRSRKALRQATSKDPAQVSALQVQKRDGGLEILIRSNAELQSKRGDVPADTAKGLPHRAYVDLSPARLGRGVKDVVLKRSKLARRVRAGLNTEDTARIVVELEGDSELQGPWPCQGGLCLFVASPTAAAPPRVAQPAARPDPAPAAQPATQPTKSPAKEPVELAAAPTPTKPAAAVAKPNPDMLPKKASSAGLSLSQQVGLHVRTIVIDPGHGGRDPGAIGPTGLREKDVVLKIAKKVAARLKKDLGVRVLLTRDKDRYVSLEQRAEIANKAHADLFISIHVNASPNRRAYGIETFYLNTTDDRYAIRLAARENTGSEKSIGDLQFILADLVTKSNVDDSRRLAKAVQSNVVARTRKKYSKVKDLGLKHALFYVLIGVRMPSVLVESAFISNRREEKRLRSNAYLDTLSDGIVRGVRSFVETQNSAGS